MLLPHEKWRGRHSGMQCSCNYHVDTIYIDEHLNTSQSSVFVQAVVAGSADRPTGAFLVETSLEIISEDPPPKSYLRTWLNTGLTDMTFWDIEQLPD
jgi:hypothetical protein